jgi:hypothetical protein
MRQRLRGLSAHTRNPSVRWGRFMLNTLWLLTVLTLFLIGALRHSSTPLMVNQAFSLGVQRATFHHLTPGPAVEWVVLALVLASIRWLALELRAVLGTNIEVRPVDNASGCTVDTHSLDVAFREYVTLPKLYQLATIPGDPEPEHLVEVLRVPSAAGWRGLLAAAFAYAFPRRAFIVSASLRMRGHEPMYGVAVQVRRLPGLATELETQWSTSFERALQRGAYAAVAHILPQTRACNNVPWSAWSRRVIPVSLFRDYQRAKKMVAERRYDEALNLYHQALIKDANNVDMRYDVGQLYERLGLYPDALYNYLNLVDQLFPHRSQARRARMVRWPKMGKRDSFVIWYRYVVVLALGAPLVRELLYPDWEELREWLADAGLGHLRRPGEERPLRTIELLDIRRLLANRLHEIYPTQTRSLEPDTTLRHLLLNPCSDGTLEHRSGVLERCLLKCAEIEARRLAHSMRWSIRRCISLRRPTSLTLTAARQLEVTIQSRLALLDRKSDKSGESGSTYSTDGIRSALSKAGYKAEKSTNWLEHYNAACIYAQIMRNDTDEKEWHLPFAHAAVSALELALRYGEDIDFVRTTKYWLQAGDPDLAGLRSYTCFRAFEARVYGVPLPATVNIAKYELYLHLRAVLEDGAGHLEREWRRRATRDAGTLTHVVFEEWWRQEEHAWELAIRLGRFYRQWQTRREAVESRRNWIESFGREARSISYPNVDQPIYVPDVGDFESIQRILKETDAIFHYLGNKCGRLAPQDNKTDRSSILTKTRNWFDYAMRCAQLVPEKNLLRSEVIEACEMRAAAWSALRHWARNPNNEQKDRFVDAVEKLKQPPRLAKRSAVKMLIWRAD